MTISTELNRSAPDSFELVFPVLPAATGIEDNEELILNIYDTIIPSVSLDVNELSWQGAKTQQAGKMTYEPWNIQFLVDEEFRNWKLLYRWLTFYNNNSDKYATENRSDYMVDATLRVVDNFRKNIFLLFFTGVWMNMLGEMSLSHREGEQVVTCQASFYYDKFELRD